jgi:hypothetical protein
VSYAPVVTFASAPERAKMWSNPGSTPLIYLLFNVNPKDEPPVVGFAGSTEEPDPFSGYSDVTLAIYCVALSAVLTVLVAGRITADHHHEIKTRARFGKKWWKK